MTTMTATTASSVRPTAARRQPAAPVPAARPRLTRRGRLTVLLVLAALLFTAFSLGRAASEASSEPVATVELEQITVQPGDTLWAVASRIAPQHDPREVIDEIRRLNELSTVELRAGQQLLLPPSA
jgi:LysM repeat protein